MTAFVVIIFIAFIVPASLIFHEIGHVVGAKLRRADQIHLTIGIGIKVFETTLFGVRIFFRLIYMLGSYTSTVRTIPLKSNEKIFITLMGPIFNLLLSVIFFYVYKFHIDEPIIFVSCLFNLWLAVMNLIPYKIGMKQSDGYIVYSLIKNKDTN